MGNIRKIITLTDQQDQWIKAQTTAGNFADDSEYIRELWKARPNNEGR